MRQARWIRLDVQWSDSEWLDDLPWPVRAVWVEFLCHVKAVGCSGTVKRFSLRKFGNGRNIPVTAVTALLEAAIAHGAVIQTDQTWTVTKWDEYQKADSTNADRQKKFREKAQNLHDLNQRNGVTNGSNTVPLSRDKDKDKDKDKSINPPAPLGGEWEETQRKGRAWQITECLLGIVMADKRPAYTWADLPYDRVNGLADYVDSIDPGGDDVRQVLDAFAAAHVGKPRYGGTKARCVSRLPYDNPIGSLRGQWFGRRETDWRKLKHYRAKDAPAQKSGLSGFVLEVPS